MAKPRPPAATIDFHRLRTALRRMDRGDLLMLLERAVERLPAAELKEVVSGFMKIGEFSSKGGVPSGLLEEVERFCKAARRGEYYEDFQVNSKNYMDRSPGTGAFIAELDRLYRRCTVASKESPDRTTRDAFEKLFALESAVDDDPDGIVFFADEGGAWQFGTDWATVVPAWARCLAATEAPDEVARLVDRVVHDHCEHDQQRINQAVAAALSTRRRKPTRSTRRSPSGANGASG